MTMARRELDDISHHHGILWAPHHRGYTISGWIIGYHEFLILKRELVRGGVSGRVEDG
jgi:hypothetical protein